MGHWKNPDRKQLARVCRMRRTDYEAMAALGINHKRFRELCAKWGIERPSERRARQGLTRKT